MKQTKPELQGQYILDAIIEQNMGGDAYVPWDQLFWLCRRQNKNLSRQKFLYDRAVLLSNDLLRLEGSRLYLSRTCEYENAAAEILASILNANELVAPPLPEKLTVGGILLDNQQREAVQMALGHRLSIIMGGAGSGKSTLVRALVDHRPAKTGYVLCAPTGKASCNLRSCTGLTARTVHSALGKAPDENFLSEVDWLYTNLVVVDEASLVTLEMLAGLLTVMGSDCRLVLLGDPHQLLSVGTGNVLPDLLRLNVPHVQLKSYYRQENYDSALAYNIREFSHIKSLEDLRFDDSFQLVQLEQDHEMLHHICKLAAPMYWQGEDVQVLSQYNSSGVVAVSKLNRFLQDLVNPASKENCIPGCPYRLADRVMVLKNDWKQGVCNGDIGHFWAALASYIPEKEEFIFGIDCGGERTAAWVGRGMLPILQLAYAITVHKSQGCGYDTVIFPLSRSSYRSLNRNMIYTALSRARKRVIIVGSKTALSVALRREPPPRASMLVPKTGMRQCGNRALPISVFEAKEGA